MNFLNKKSIICASITVSMLLQCVPEEDSWRSKVKKFCKVITQSLHVCDDAIIDGNLTVRGTVTGTIPGLPIIPIYVFATTNATDLIVDQQDIIFLTTSPASGVSFTTSSSTPAGTAIVLPAGTYQFFYSLDALIGFGQPVVLQLFNNTTATALLSTYKSDDETGLAPVVARNVKGAGIFTLTQTSAISLRNVSANDIELVSFDGSAPTGSDITASVFFIKIA